MFLNEKMVVIKLPNVRPKDILFNRMLEMSIPEEELTQDIVDDEKRLDEYRYGLCKQFDVIDMYEIKDTDFPPKKKLGKKWKYDRNEMKIIEQEDHECLCSENTLIKHFVIKNTKTGISGVIGSVCVLKFLSKELERKCSVKLNEQEKIKKGDICKICDKPLMDLRGIFQKKGYCSGECWKGQEQCLNCEGNLENDKLKIQTSEFFCNKDCKKFFNTIGRKKCNHCDNYLYKIKDLYHENGYCDYMCWNQTHKCKYCCQMLEDWGVNAVIQVKESFCNRDCKNKFNYKITFGKKHKGKNLVRLLETEEGRGYYNWVNKQIKEDEKSFSKFKLFKTIILETFLEEEI